MRNRRTAAGAVAAGLAMAAMLMSAVPASGAATPSPSPCPSVDPSASPSVKTLPSPGVSQACIDAAKAQQAALKQIQQALGSTLAEGLAAQQQLSASILQNQKQQNDLRQMINADQQREAELDAEAVQLDNEIAATQKRVEAERTQIRELARVVYTQPDSVLVLLAQADSLGDLITRVSDLMAAGSRADELKRQLDADLQKIRTDRAKVAADRDEVAQKQAAEAAGLAKLKKLHQQEMDSAAKLAAKLAETKTEIQAAAKQSNELAKKITQMLEQQEEAIIAAAMQQVWDQYEAWAKANPVVAGAPSSGHSKQFRVSKKVIRCLRMRTKSIALRRPMKRMSNASLRGVSRAPRLSCLARRTRMNANFNREGGSHQCYTANQKSLIHGRLSRQFGVSRRARHCLPTA